MVSGKFERSNYVGIRRVTSQCRTKKGISSRVRLQGVYQNRVCRGSLLLFVALAGMAIGLLFG